MEGPAQKRAWETDFVSRDCTKCDELKLNEKKGHTSTETSSSRATTLTNESFAPSKKALLSSNGRLFMENGRSLTHSIKDVGPTFHVPGSAFVNEAAQFVSGNDGEILIFDNIDETHIISETALIPSGDYQPQLQIKFTGPIAREISFRISPIRSSMDLLIWASTHHTREATCLSQFIISPKLAQMYLQHEWISIELPPFSIKEPSQFLVEVISSESLSKAGIQLAFFSILTSIPPPLSLSRQRSSPIKESATSSSSPKEFDISHFPDIAEPSLGKDRIFECPHAECDRSFTRVFNLKSHMKVHESVRSREFVCPSCQTGFARSQDLSRHALTHSGEKKFVCPGCNKRFSRKDALRRHIRATQCCPMDAIG